MRTHQLAREPKIRRSSSRDHISIGSASHGTRRRIGRPRSTRPCARKTLPEVLRDAPRWQYGVGRTHTAPVLRRRTFLLESTAPGRAPIAIKQADTFPAFKRLLRRSGENLACDDDTARPPIPIEIPAWKGASVPVGIGVHVARAQASPAHTVRIILNRTTTEIECCAETPP